jgi:multiple sugar transport system permease protein
LIFFVGWQVYPIFRVLWMSFTDYHFLRNQPSHFVGIQNYANALSDPLVLNGLIRAATFTAWFLPGMIFVPMFLAILVDRVSHPMLAATYRLILLIPAVIPGPLIFVLWKWLYNFNIGPIDYFLIQTGLFTAQTAPQWLGDARLTLPAIAIMEVWWGLGYHTMFYLAGLAAIPRELSEAARVDGAGHWQTFRSITFPLLVPAIGTVSVLTFIFAMEAFALPYALGGSTGNPAGATDFMSLLFYRTAFENGSTNAIGSSSAIATLLFAVIFGGAVLATRVLRHTEARIAA